MSTFLKADKVVATSLGLLVRELVLPRLVWRDAAFDPRLAKNDTVSLKLPAYAPARRRALRSGAARTKDALTERKVDVTLNVDVYKDIGITDEELTLDIADFGAQVLNPVVQGIGLQLEQEIGDAIANATYENTIAFVASSGDAYKEVAVKARELLNNAHVPQAGRVLLVGSTLESSFLNNDKFVNADKSGSTDTLREAIIGRVAGFTVVSTPAIPPNRGYAFHSTAFAMAQRAPLVPAGAPWGEVRTYDNFALRTVRVFDPDLVEDRFVADSWIGVSPVYDDGYIDANGVFVPTSGDTTVGPSVTLATSAAADDIIDTATAHGFKVNDQVVFSGLTGGTGLSNGTTYYVISANLAAQTFQVATTQGGSAVNFSSDITAGTVAEKARPLMVRAVKITVS